MVLAVVLDPDEEAQRDLQLRRKKFDRDNIILSFLLLFYYEEAQRDLQLIIKKFTSACIL